MDLSQKKRKLESELFKILHEFEKDNPCLEVAAIALITRSQFMDANESLVNVEATVRVK